MWLILLLLLLIPLALLAGTTILFALFVYVLFALPIAAWKQRGMLRR